MSARPRVLLVTTADHPEGEPDHAILDGALTGDGMRGSWVCWDDPFVDWSAAEVVVVRAVAAEVRRTKEFLGWAGGLGSRLLHAAALYRWNDDPYHLLELAAHGGAPVVPVVAAARVVDLRAALHRLGPSAVLPRHGGAGPVVVRDAESWRPPDPGPWVVRPVLDPVEDHEGTLSVSLLRGHPVCQLSRDAAGAVTEVPMTHEAALVAVDAVAAASEVTGQEIFFAQVEMRRHEGTLLVCDLDVAAPPLHLDVAPELAVRFAGALAERLGIGVG